MLPLFGPTVAHRVQYWPRRLAPASRNLWLNSSSAWLLWDTQESTCWPWKVLLLKLWVSRI